MLRYNLSKLFSMRGITNKAELFIKNGFSKRVTYNILSGKFRQLSLEQTETLCLALKCTPNDLLEWIPDKNVRLEDDMPLKKLLGGNIDYNILKIVRDVPMDKMEEFTKKMEEIKRSL